MEVLFFMAAIAILVMAGVAKISADKHRTYCADCFSGIPNFMPSTKYIGDPNESAIAMDATSQTIALVIDKRLIMLPFSQIMAVEVVKNGVNLTQTNRGSQVAGAAVGAMLLGPVGLILGGVTGGKTTKEKISHLSLKVRTTDLNNPVRDIVFYNASPELAGSPKIKQKLKEMDEWHSRILVIISARLTPPSKHP